MKKLQLDFPVFDEDGKNIDPQKSAGKLLAASLLRRASNDEGDITKLFGWAMILAKDEPIEIDKGDYKKLKTLVVSDPDMFIILKAPLLDALEKLKFT